MLLRDSIHVIISLLKDPCSRNDSIILNVSSCVGSLRELYKNDFAFRAIFNSYFPPGSMVLNPQQANSCERFEICNLFAHVIMLLCKRFGQTEREKTRFVETRNFMVAAVVIGFEGKHVIEIGGLNHPVIVSCIKALSYSSFTNKEYAVRFHSSHRQLLEENHINNFHYHTVNFEESQEIEELCGPKVVYSSNTFEHVQNTSDFLDKIYELGQDCVTYFCFGPVRSHSYYGHHSSYSPTDLFMSNTEIDSFHLLSQEEQYRIIKNSFRRINKQITDTEILMALSKSNTSSHQMLNNYTVSDYHRIFHVSKLNLERIQSLVDLSAASIKSQKRKLYTEKPQIGDIVTRNLLVILSNDSNYFRVNHPHLTIDTDPNQTHWLQSIQY